MAFYRKKPVVIEAVQLAEDSLDELAEFCGFNIGDVENPLYGSGIVIETLEGNMLARKGDWIIKGVNGEFYPCKPDIFEKTYEKVAEVT
jgi:hypothetical protein